MSASKNSVFSVGSVIFKIEQQFRYTGTVIDNK